MTELTLAKFVSTGALGLPDSRRKGELDIFKVLGRVDKSIKTHSVWFFNTIILLSIILMDDSALFKEWIYKNF